MWKAGQRNLLRKFSDHYGSSGIIIFPSGQGSLSHHLDIYTTTKDQPMFVGQTLDPPVRPQASKLFVHSQQANTNIGLLHACMHPKVVVFIQCA